MRVLFCTTGGLGHLLPLRPLAEALRRRGHEIAWVTAPDALAALKGSGFDLFAAGPGFEVGRRQFRAAHAEAEQLAGEPLSAYTFPRLFGAVLAPAMVDGVEQAARRWRPDFVVHEPAALAAPLVCRQLGLRSLTHGYGLPPPGRYIEDAMRRFGAHWRARGLAVPADGGLYRHLYLDIAPRSLRPSCETTEEMAFRFNPHRPDAADACLLPAGVGTLLQGAAKRGPRIYVTFGTVFNRSPAMIAAAGAAARLGGTVVVTVGADGDPAPFAALGGHVSVHRFVDQAALLPHCDLVVSHGGAGTLLGAAAHGVPQLILPQAADHFRNARALLSVNAGRAVEPERQATEGVMAAMADTLSSRTIGAAAGALAREMSAMPDPAAAARRLERWQASRRSRSE
ncbi:MAG: glycosyltransferase family 1 protein [Piscinibacter sp.]|nr:glycosyltransferase family 1 protein [Piscinibacter sp.]